ncbi:MULTISPECIES: YiaA/YiaB family inner membrane protein [unclassified Pseudonocardia]|uniref:YiaA/YiaB family inner membrane protein n=1 Tax=unclassified Pseudonocardia TaxID=2619320 RepID=UPI0027E12EBC|nr:MULTISPECIES: YiaA/YiaB family inner membrane protein [unclassified Pseudonocardia]
MKAFLAIAVLYAITSAFTLAKCVRDRQESLTVVNRVDQARMEKLLAEHDPFRSVA